MRDLAASVRARLLDLARRQGEDFGRVAVRFALERLLYRLGRSRHRERFVLKGAMLFAGLGQGYRPTRDLDLLGFGPDEVGQVLEAFREIVALDGQDGLSFDAASLRGEPIREGAEYGGVRLQLLAYLGTMRIPVRVDVGFGDAVTPGPAELSYPVLLELPAPRVRAYPLETVVAEKLEAVVRLGLANSRVKDFYDLWAIARGHRLEAATLGRAIERTFARRGTALPRERPAGFSSAFTGDAGKRQAWRAFLSRITQEELGLEGTRRHAAGRGGMLVCGGRRDGLGLPGAGGPGRSGGKLGSPGPEMGG